MTGWRRAGSLLGVAATASIIAAACGGGDDLAGPEDGGPASSAMHAGPDETAPDAADDSESLVATSAANELGPRFHFLPLDAEATPGGRPILRGPVRPPFLDLDSERFPMGDPWRTNWRIRIADADEIVAVLPRDRITPLDDPSFDGIAAGDAWLPGNHPVIQMQINGDARAFPLGIISRHEVVNTTIGGRAIAVTFCPLCNSAIAFERVLEGQIVEFSVSGMLRNSDLVMWDRTTETLWQQLTGEALVGAMSGMTLDLLPAPIVSWGQFKQAFPQGLVLSRDTGFTADYNLNVYEGYDSRGPYARFFGDETDPRLRANERVVAVDRNDDRVAYTFELLARERVLQDALGGEKIVVVWTPGTASALDGDAIAESRDVGATGVFRRELGGRRLSFAPNPDDEQTFVDRETRSVWDIFGRAVSGELAGAQLEAVVHGSHFWFAWAAFFPDTELVR